MSGPPKQLDTLRNTLRNRAVDLQNRLEDNQGRYNYQSCADAEAVLIVLSEGSGRPSQRPPRGGSYIGTPRPAPNRSIVSSSHALASVRVSSGDVEMAETAPTPPTKTSEGKGTSEGSSATKSSKKKKGKKKEEPIPISDDEAPVTTQRASRPRTPHQLVTLLSFLTFVWSQLKPLLRLLQETTISTAELVDQAQKTVSAGQELSRKRARADSEEAATTVRQVQALRDQYRLINPGAVQGILRDNKNCVQKNMRPIVRNHLSLNRELSAGGKYSD
ncbi:hypothetical protein K435DRAFT_803585 [Dendrothele bispora CBS 962.96]|uniref:Uncharacterized protein n=1 Tax=Dendrothele bispora (strain CBS 962.96) TaxID=1314807 RepID=A0A4S8LH00_DENBC|nr:hypothetical protein K435DRAFT_803585 [Dendrothele bispora CBS 962.96]